MDVLPTIPDESIDAVVCDPPYGLSDHRHDLLIECLQSWLAGHPFKPRVRGFAGKAWDAWVMGPEVWRECLRTLKPGGHLLAFAGTRSMDLTCMAIRLAGFEIRDSIGFAQDDADRAPLLAWVRTNGMPKSRDLERVFDDLGDPSAAAAWRGWSSNLRPAWDPIIVARKPLSGTLAANVRKWGTGALNVDACRVPLDLAMDARNLRTITRSGRRDSTWGFNRVAGGPGDVLNPKGRWPANVIVDGSEAVSQALAMNRITGGAAMGDRHQQNASVARFFYCTKTSARDRHDGLAMPGTRFKRGATLRQMHNAAEAQQVGAGNTHVSVKPTALMRYLCRLVTPHGGTVLDPTMGSGSTPRAALMEGFACIGIEVDREQFGIACARVKAATESREDVGSPSVAESPETPRRSSQGLLFAEENA